MTKVDDQVLKTTKEIVVKFIEAGRISPASVHETFKEVYKTVLETIAGTQDTPPEPESDTES